MIRYASYKNKCFAAITYRSQEPVYHVIICSCFGSVNSVNQACTKSGLRTNCSPCYKAFQLSPLCHIVSDMWPTTRGCMIISSAVSVGRMLGLSFTAVCRKQITLHFKYVIMCYYYFFKGRLINNQLFN